MAATPGKPRIPVPKPSGIPTPGRSRASSTVLQQNNAANAAIDAEYMSRAFAEAIKANDPAQHRPAVTSRSPKSGRHSVAGRPSSVASTSSVASSSYPRAKTPVQSHSRPPSRISDVLPKVSPKAFEVGDNVRVESLGFEGTLRYLGPIEGKQGSWAGVQLSGGFAGKGKNNGAVNGIQYFTCPDKCGVFVSVVKLSPPTVGAGAIHRPPSAASSRGGRITPAFSGRPSLPASASITAPRVSSSSSSISNGRVTPSSSGRITPSMSSGHVTPSVTPGARVRRPLTKTPSKPEVPVPVQNFTAGSIASKYVSMTAKQLSSRDAAIGSPRRRPELESPTRSLSLTSSRNLASPIRPIGSPFVTPKPGLEGRAGSGTLSTPSRIRASGSLTTPRARIPSAVAMPPPASPMSARSVSLSDLDGSDFDTFSPKAGHPRKSAGPMSTRSDSVASFRSLAGDEHLIDQLRSRIEALEYDNERLRLQQSSVDATEQEQQHQHTQHELDEARSKILSLESSLNVSKANVDSQETRIKLLEEAKERIESELASTSRTMEDSLSASEAKLHAALEESKELQSKVVEHETSAHRKESALRTHEETIASLEARISTLNTELHNEKVELGAQIDELRSAGQETIALYEERLSTADSQRYDLENRISTLESRLQNAQKAAAASTPPPSNLGASAAEIDNETLREQIVHLQRKIGMMEDSLEDAQATAEREETLMRERMKRLKEKEDAMKKELNDGRKEVEQVLKSEARARGRIEEIEEALRESTVALENARAEVENLRAELANLNGLVPNSSGGDLSSRVADAAQRAANEKAQYLQEIAELHQSIERYRARENTSSVTSSGQVTELRQENASLLARIGDLEMKISALSQSLDDTTKELETLRKKHNRDASINNGLQEPTSRAMTSSPSSAKHDSSAAKEEIMGLKHIVQELQKENVINMQRIKILESENQILSSEANQLRQEVQILEDNLDKSLDQEDNVTGDNLRGVNGDGDSPQRLKDQKNRLEVEQEQLRKKLVDVEMKSTRTIHDLNKEISELEALVEAKIYREDELEQEVERLREKLARQGKKNSKSSTDTVVKVVSEPVCEICERPGHDIFGCDVLNKGGMVTGGGVGGGSVEDLFCEECESHGHIAANCPHSLDVF
ncbi:hypothetical protein H0H92_012134 [Tricholoma furcatifolium]|nr:hypothetical protein H0H92_012134 [Tricholoma furcatifolium]